MKKSKFIRVFAIVLGCLTSAYVFDLLTNIKLYIELFLFGLFLSFFIFLKKRN